MKKRLFFTLLFLTALQVSGQWTLKQNNILGDTNRDVFGKAISISGDGSRVIIGASQNDGRNHGKGYVRVFDNTSGTYTQIGLDLFGENNADAFGFSVDISKDGNIIAVGAPKSEPNSTLSSIGSVKIYQFINNNWEQLGNDIVGEAAGDESGYSVRLNAQGNIIVIGARFNDTDGIGEFNDGHVRVYKYDSGSWSQIGNDIDGTDGNRYGTSASISDDGNTLAMGSRNGAQVYKNVAGNWQQVGIELVGTSIAEGFGAAVDLSSDGEILAVGAKNDSGVGYVKIYKNNSGNWSQIGSTITSDQSLDSFGASLSLSSEGNVIAIGAPFNNNPYSNSGSVKIFKNDNNIWTQIDNEIEAIDGTDFRRLIGSSVSLSSNGTILAIGLPELNGTGFGSAGPGMIRIYENDSFVPKPFITKWKTTTANEYILIPTEGSGYNYTVDWGDGTIESGFTGEAHHSYTVAGEYEVSITGDFPRIYFYNYAGQSSQIIDVLQWGTNQWQTMNVAFFSLFNLSINASDIPDLSNVTDMSNMFYNCTSFNSNISNWDVSNVTNMQSMFQGATSFNQDIGSWNTSNVTSMSSMFSGATSFNQDLSSWDVSKVTDMVTMFWGTNFNQNLSKWDVSQVIYANQMFSQSALSVINYDKTLIGWSKLAGLQRNVTFITDGVNYCNSETQRNKLISDFGWTIIDEGKDCSTIDSPVSVNGLWNDPTNWASGVIPTTTDNVVIPTGTTLQISDDISEINSLENEGTIVINSTFSLKSKSNMVNNGTIIMDSGTDDSSVLFIEGTSTGNVVYKRGGLKANKWSLVTPPVSGQKIKEFATNVENDIRKNETVSPVKYAIAYYDDKEPSGSKWKYFTESIGTEETFTAGESYGLSRSTDGAVTFTGTLTTNNSIKTLKPGEWNAIGNPFTTYYPANKNESSSFLNDNYDILDDNFKGLYIWDASQNKYVIVSELDLQNRSFPPGQGFFIKVKPSENTIEFKEAKRSLKPSSGEVIFQKNQQKYIQLFADDGLHKVSTDIKFFDNASFGFDVGLDIGNFDASFDIFTKLVDKSNTKNYTIQSIPSKGKEDVIIPLEISTGKSKVIFSTNHQNLTQGTILYLEDKKNNTLTDITNSDVKISFEDKENTIDRFYLHVSSQNVLNTNENTLDDIKIYANNQTLFLRGIQKQSSVKIVNLLGMEVFSKSIKSDDTINLSNLIETGVYLVKLTSDNIFKIKKIIIK